MIPTTAIGFLYLLLAAITVGFGLGCGAYIWSQIVRPRP
jgi:hypothetical protein